MKYIELLEDYADDIKYSKMADEVWNALSRFFDNTKMGQIEQTTQHKLCVRVEDLNVNVGVPLDDLVIIFLPAHWANGGSYNRAKLGKIKHIISIRIDVMDSEYNEKTAYDAIKDYLLVSDRARKVFKHEFQHYIDSKRYKGDWDSVINSDSNVTGTKKYFNSSIEFNAFFHMIADRLTSDAKIMTRTPPAIEHIYSDKYNEPFDEWLKENLKQYDSRWDIAGEFISNLTDNNMKRLYKRLYKLYNHIQQLKNDYNENDID